eukprot:TRINITY_DN60986_c0_g1_i1.p1 TRINITY_DN60986_c0_g1~~TRINITY_DN60986_c0_g1_i1.p1  ORF type:complete len:280 (-),score=32.72 TRINITY_DN60986_c0_g1_i1:68-907(-)
MEDDQLLEKIRKEQATARIRARREKELAKWAKKGEQRRKKTEDKLDEARGRRRKDKDPDDFPCDIAPNRAERIRLQAKARAAGGEVDADFLAQIQALPEDEQIEILMEMTAAANGPGGSNSKSSPGSGAKPVRTVRKKAPSKGAGRGRTIGGTNSTATAQEELELAMAISLSQQEYQNTGGVDIENIGMDYETLCGLQDVKVGLPQPLKDKIKKVSWSDKVSKQEGLTDDKCPICLCEYEDDEEVSILPCCHSYHFECLDEWLNERKRCCICKSEVEFD